MDSEWPEGEAMRPDRRATVEEAQRIDVLYLHRNGAWRGRYVDGWPVDLTKSQEYRVRVVWTPCHFGGRRPWFRCPWCQWLGRFLYSHGHLYVCRSCANLTYRSRQASRDPDKMARHFGVHPGDAPGSNGRKGMRAFPILWLRSRLRRTKNPERRARLERRIARLQQVEMAPLLHLRALSDRMEASLGGPRT
jgi:hypothetical protein